MREDGGGGRMGRVEGEILREEGEREESEGREEGGGRRK